jgi:YHS domain-containing protein
VNYVTKKQLEANGYQLEEKEDFVMDLVCGMELSLEEAKFSAEYKGETYYFCSENCKEHFQKNPDMYLVE